MMAVVGLGFAFGGSQIPYVHILAISVLFLGNCVIWNLGWVNDFVDSVVVGVLLFAIVAPSLLEKLLKSEAGVSRKLLKEKDLWRQLVGGIASGLAVYMLIVTFGYFNTPFFKIIFIAGAFYY
mmetsp:Transcript_29702/g.45277  ORF Transcript_29702/g.45277 Transcript_29702/m.45277 type:complete len:123 (+) Transcript_29702:2-370(+)